MYLLFINERKLTNLKRAIKATAPERKVCSCVYIYMHVQYRDIEMCKIDDDSSMVSAVIND